MTRGVSQRSQAFGRASIRPVGFGRILYSQDEGHGVETTRGRLNRTLDNILRGTVIVGEKARGGFAHRAAATGFGQSGTRTLGEGMGQLDQTLGPPQVAEVRVGKCCDGPARRIEAVAPV